MASTFLLGIGGGTGSGKTTLAGALRKRMGARHVAVVHMDRYFRPGATSNNRPSAIDDERLRTHIGSLKNGRSIILPGRRDLPPERIDPHRIVLVEGHLCLAFDWLVEWLDLSIYVDMDPEERLLRRLQRNVSERGQELQHAMDWYRQDVVSNYQRFIAPTKLTADLIVWGEWTERRLSRLALLVQRMAQLGV